MADKKDMRVRIRLANDIVQRAADSACRNSRNLQAEVNHILRQYFLRRERRPL